MHRVVVDVRHWMMDRRFAGAFAISRMSRGPNVPIVTLIGNAVAGVVGALVVMLAMRADCSSQSRRSAIVQAAPAFATRLDPL
jgi:hypothetical protein